MLNLNKVEVPGNGSSQDPLCGDLRDPYISVVHRVLCGQKLAVRNHLTFII